MAKPIIGITSDYLSDREPKYTCHRAYSDAISKAGGIPVLLPYLEYDESAQFISSLSGFLLTGGIDFAPSLYGGGDHSSIELVGPERDEFEIATIRYAKKRDIPILDICRGMQLMNVVAGGNIYQHTLDSLPEAFEHRPDVPFAQKVHDISVDPDSKLGLICGDQLTFGVNSRHHQAVNEIGEGFRVSARSADGVIEAIEALSWSFAIGVEWHPEHLVETEAVALNLFHAFVEACSLSDHRRRTP